MELSHRFTVPTPVEETWSRFQDIASIAECFPGAQVTGVEGDTFQGTCKVKLGPIALTYAGSGTFVQRDEAAHSFVVEAKGRDKRGNGTAGATVTLSMAPSASSGTDVAVDTDLSITGKPAQFGRGVMQDVSDKLLGQFVSCLEQRLGETAPPPAEEPVPEEPVPEEPVAEASSAPVPAAAATDSSTAAPPSPPRTPPSTPPPMAPPAANDDALDLGATVLPVLLKSYWRQGAGALVVVLALVRWLRR